MHGLKRMQYIHLSRYGNCNWYGNTAVYYDTVMAVCYCHTSRHVHVSCSVVLCRFQPGTTSFGGAYLTIMQREQVVHY